MDRSEQLVAQYLNHRGFVDVCYEPDGNVPPDFLLDGRVAVEVRRLNQLERTTGSPRGLEEVDIPLEMKFRKLLDRFGPPPTGVSWFVFYRYSRPLESWRTLGPKVRAWLQTLRDTQPAGIQYHAIGSFSLRAVHATTAHTREFLVGGVTDEESGGWVLEIMAESLDACIREKSAKVAAYRSKYPAWWLIFVDHIGYHLDDPQRELLRQAAPSAQGWDKVILVNPLNPTLAFELY